MLSEGSKTAVSNPRFGDGLASIELKCNYKALSIKSLKMTEITQLHDYSDPRGNQITVASAVEFRNSRLSFRDKKAMIAVGEGTILAQCEINLGTGSVLEIHAGCRISGKITVGYNSRIVIGKELRVTSNLNLRAVESTSITIGDDCLFASNVSIRTSDGHPLYDANTRERVNYSASVSIGHHVWLADDVIILKGVEIGNASVVGVRSLVTKSIPANCVAAGSPAKVLRTGTTWELKPGLVTEAFYVSD